MKMATSTGEYSELKTKLHNAHQNIRSLKKRRKQLRGRIGRLQDELKTAEKMLQRCAEALECEHVMLASYEKAHREWLGI
jgi:chromosome segregation ATPase